MMCVWGLVLVVLLMICWQDYKFRAVHWWLFVLLFFGLGSISYRNLDLSVCLERVVFNSGFVGVQLVFLTLYFSLKHRQPVNIFKGYFGIGDLCFLLAVSLYFSLINFVLFYVLSLLLVILTTSLTQGIKTKCKIPLAGYQSFYLFVLMVLDHHSSALKLNANATIWIF